MKKAIAGAVALALLPFTAQAQMFEAGRSSPGIYLGPQGGLNWLMNSGNTYMDIGYAVGGVVGYDFVGPRVELEGVFRSNNGSGTGTTNFGNVFSNTSGRLRQLAVMANLLYDFAPGATITPYVGAGAGISFLDPAINQCDLCSTQFAYQAILGLGWNIDQNFRVNLDGRYHGTTNPGTYQNNNIGVMLGITYKFGETAAPPPPPPAAAQPAAPSFMVFFDWDRADITPQALNTIRQAVQQFRTRGNARITATGHTDRSGPDSYNMALSLRRGRSPR
jgi:OmpA-OmpF porin, OOP family